MFEKNVVESRKNGTQKQAAAMPQIFGFQSRPIDAPSPMSPKMATIATLNSASAMWALLASSLRLRHSSPNGNCTAPAYIGSASDVMTMRTLASGGSSSRS